MSKFLNQDEINRILSSHYIGRLACCKDEIPYIVPVTYCFDKADNSIIGYTGLGKKLYMLRRNPHVCFEVDEIEGLSQWKTVVATGEFEEMEGMNARKALHFFVERIKMQLNTGSVEQHAKFLKDMTHAEIHFSESVIYRIRITEKNGRYES